MSFHVNVLYPNPEGATFDLDYYLKSHMPLVKKNWSSFGLKGYTVTQAQPGPDGAKPQYSILAVLHWEKAEDVGKAMGDQDTAGPILGDIPNFSNQQPIFLTGPVVGKD
ncbi:uncharacterized protein HMPREF1541_02291 [Cyphellophora europaea CBS 101466]|uniref:EthD domain-containing protein n=1 Tax=Cyphellophora europaea (strain CBS 101466) TaxID=1220924 RepID=W2S511_CYPE1|nr:uncharacterized protein HMPREF1541_02291 [Cyphellophora europaea CBS 101466]ETN43133.1 hypothetical protein HMPREF1541_02291 [Cyphellophora europaea CBS 101466]